MAARKKKAQKQKPPPCEPKPRRIRIDAEPFCERTQRYCRTESYPRGGARDSNSMILIGLGLLALIAYNASKKPTPPEDGGPLPQLPPGANRTNSALQDRQTTFPPELLEKQK